MLLLSAHLPVAAEDGECQTHASKEHVIDAPKAGAHAAGAAAAAELPNDRPKDGGASATEAAAGALAPKSPPAAARTSRAQSLQSLHWRHHEPAQKSICAHKAVFQDSQPVKWYRLIQHCTPDTSSNTRASARPLAPQTAPSGLFGPREYSKIDVRWLGTWKGPPLTQRAAWCRSCQPKFKRIEADPSTMVGKYISTT